MIKKDLIQALSQISFYKQFPVMKPFIGDYYISEIHKKLLLVGESYYLPNETTVHHSPSVWYKSNQKVLNEDEIEWINCDGLLTCDWEGNGHQIYRELNKCIFSLKIDKKKRAMDEVAFTNYFQRPAEKEGESFKYFCTEEDINNSDEILDKVVKIIKPDIVIFVSKYAWDTGGIKLKNNFTNIIVDFVCHPGTGGRYWHNAEYPHNKTKFIKILKKNFI